MRIGIIGVCNVTLDFANRAAKSGHEVLISNPRCNGSLKPIVQRMGDKVKLVTKDKALKANMLILFIPRDELDTFLHDLPDMTEKILLHTNNPYFDAESLVPNLATKSSSEIIASVLPAAHVVKIFNVLEPIKSLPKNQCQNGNEIFYMGSNRQAKNRVKSFLKTLNFCGCDLEDMYKVGHC